MEDYNRILDSHTFPMSVWEVKWKVMECKVYF